MTSPFACESARSYRVTVGGLSLHALEWGRPGQPSVLLLHGGSAHAHWFDAVAHRLAETRHVVALDQRGHGESDWARPAAYASEDFVGDIALVLDALGWRTAALVGHSMGGHNAIVCAAWRPDRVRQLVVVDSRPAIPAERLAHMRERAERPARRHASMEAAVAAFRLLPPDTLADPALLAHLAGAGMTWRDGAVTTRFDPACPPARKPADAWPLLPRITAPTLVVRGARSPILPREMAERVVAELADGRLVEIPDAYHHLLLDRPEAFARVLDDFLDAGPPSGSAATP